MFLPKIEDTTTTTTHDKAEEDSYHDPTDTASDVAATTPAIGSGTFASSGSCWSFRQPTVEA